MNTHITQRSVQAAKPPASGYIILFDHKIAGFGCRVTAAGAKSFILNYRVGGEKRRYTIGSWPKWTADAARDEAANVLLPAINKKGADPVRDKKALRDEPKMEALAKEYIEQHAEAKKREKSVYEDKRMLNKIILPKLGQRRVSSVTKREIELLHNSLRNTPYHNGGSSLIYSNPPAQDSRICTQHGLPKSVTDYHGRISTIGVIRRD